MDPANPEACKTTEDRIRADYLRRKARGNLSARRVMLVDRYGPKPMESSESVRMQLLDGKIQVLDYRFGF